MQPEAVIVLLSGGLRYAVARCDVAALRRDPGGDAPSLARLLGDASATDGDMTVSTVAGAAVRVAHADLHAALPRLDLPAWLVPQVHPAVAGVVLDGAELMPIVQLGLLSLQTGHNAA